MLKNIKNKVVVGSLLVVASVSSAFASVDVSGLTSAATDVGTVGAAALTAIFAAVAFKYVRRAL